MSVLLRRGTITSGTERETREWRRTTNTNRSTKSRDHEPKKLSVTAVFERAQYTRAPKNYPRVRPRPRRRNAVNRVVTKATRAAVFIFVAFVLFVPAKAADDIAQESRFISNPRQLIYEGKRSGEGYFQSRRHEADFPKRGGRGIRSTRCICSILSRAKRHASRRAWAKRRAAFSSRAQVACSLPRPTPIPKAPRNKKPNWIFARAASSGATRGITMRRWTSGTMRMARDR